MDWFDSLSACRRSYAQLRLARTGCRTPPHVVVQVGVGAFRGSQAHPDRDVFDRERRLAAQPGRNLQLVRIVLPALVQISFPPTAATQFLGEDPLRPSIGGLAMQLAGVVFSQAAAHPQEHLASKALAAQAPPN